MNITIFGSGYVGLTTGICFAHMGNQVICVDINSSRVAELQQGICPLFEPGLAEMLKENRAAQRIHFTTDIAAAIIQSELIMIAVGTPPSENGAANLDQVFSVAKTIATHLTDYKLIVTKSTVPVGTTDEIKRIITTSLSQQNRVVPFDVAFNPEFLKEGDAVNDFLKPDRIIIGTDSPKAEKLLRTLYAPFSRQNDKLIVMDIRSAELTKYAANAMLATRISFMNEMSNIAEVVGADIEKVRVGIGSDTRIGYSFLYPGCGYGGSCFPKDILALQYTAKTNHYTPHILNAIHHVNEQQKKVLLTKINHYFNHHLKGKHFALWGLAFKPNTDDIRDAPSRILMEGLWQAGATISAFDPEAMSTTQKTYGARPDLKLCEHIEETLTQADALIIATEWPHFRSPDFKLIKKKLKHAVIFDGRNLYDPQHLKQLGIDYIAIGRSNYSKI